METPLTSEAPLRCPECGALVVDRRFAACTSCHAQLPKGWILSEEQIGKLAEIDHHARAEHAAVMSDLDPENQPDSMTTLEPPVDSDSL
jgi:hypothetical protein